MIDWVVIVNQVPSVAMALLFAWFALRLLERMDNAASRRDDAWREFLTQEREARKESTARLAEELKENTTSLVMLGQAMDRHDKQVTSAIEVMKDRTVNNMDKKTNQ